MKQPDTLIRANEALRARLSRMSRASLQINESLDFDAVLQSVLDSACSLTGARCGVLTLLDETGQPVDLLSSGVTPEEAQRLWDLPDGMRLFAHFGNVPEPLRLHDLIGHIRSMGLPEIDLPAGVSSPVSFLTAPIRHGGERVGNIFLGVTEPGRAFIPEDEETLVMFAGQAALVIANARRYRDEQRARNNLETLIRTAPVGVAVLDAKAGRLLSFNRETERIVSSLQMPGRSLEQLLELVTFRRADGREIALEEFPLARALHSGETVRFEEIVLQVPDGRSAKVLINATPIFTQEGDVESYIVTLQDMAPLEELERLRTAFMGMVSHELRLPLSAIKGSTATLLDEESALDPAEMRQFLRIISNQADRMRSLIRDLLDMARIEAGALSVDPEPSAIAALVDEARIMFVSTGHRHNIQIDIEPDLPQVMADRRRIVQVFSNLLTNAARYSNDLSTIRVRAALEQYQVVVSIADEGKGIPAERLPLLFRKYSRIDGEEQREDLAGSGLGLAICRGIVEAHGGRIWAESDGLGQGARFIFTIPVAAREDIGGAFEPLSPTAGTGKAAENRARILVVDDDPHELRQIRDALAKSGYEPIVTGEPEDVDRLIEEEKPRLVLLDMMLPGIDGVDLMTRIQKKAELPVIFLSAYGQEKVIAKAFDMGAADYVVKPFAPTELAARIRAALRRHAGESLSVKSGAYTVGELAINYAERSVSVAGRPVVLTATEYALLFALSTSAGSVLTHDQLLRRVWGEGHSGDVGLVRTIVRRLRLKLGDDTRNPEYIFTKSRVGYHMPRGERPELVRTAAGAG